MKTIAKIVPAALLAALAGCATSPPEPVEEMGAARSAVRIAGDNGAPNHASVEYQLAQNKLERARAALENGETQRARHLAEQAEMDARYADLKTRSAKTRRSIRELEAGIKALRRELEREVQS